MLWAVSKKIYFMHQVDFRSGFYQSLCPSATQNNMQCSCIVIKKSPKYKLYDNIGDLSKATFWYHNNDTKRNLGSCYVHIAELMTHPAVYTLRFNLQLCYKPLGILQRVTKSQKVHISSHDVLKNLYNINFAWNRFQGFLTVGVEKQEFPLSSINVFENN